jgi:predicted ester cyclase
MPDTLVETNLQIPVEEIMNAYFETHDLQYVDEDATFKLVFSGEEHHGREAIAGMLNYFYKVAFDAHPDKKNVIFGDRQAVAEADFVGKHIGEFAGIPATQKQVRVPFIVVYEVGFSTIKQARIYFPMDVLVKQLI